MAATLRAIIATYSNCNNNNNNNSDTIERH